MPEICANLARSFTDNSIKSFSAHLYLDRLHLLQLALDVTKKLRYYLFTYLEVTMKIEDLTVDIDQSVEIKGALEDVFKSVLHRLGAGNTAPNGESLNLQIEPFAGGRWFRDRGEGVQHLWGHVQVIKPPVLLELSGPLFMSYPALNHIEVKLEPAGETIKVTLRHRAIGLLKQSHREGFVEGWKLMLDRVKNDFTQAQSAGS